jgi:hypothetical protein
MGELKMNTYLKNRIERYKVLDKRIKNTKDVELYEQKLISLPVTCIDWLKEHPKINFSAECAKTTYRLMNFSSGREREIKDLVQNKFDNWQKLDPDFQPRLKLVDSIVEAYFCAEKLKEYDTIKHLEEILQKVAPDVLSHLKFKDNI